MADLTRESHFPPKAAFRLNADLCAGTSVPWVIQATRTSCRLSSEANELLENLGLNHLLDQETSGASSTLPAPSVLVQTGTACQVHLAFPHEPYAKMPVPASHRLCGKHSSEHLPGRASLSWNRLSKQGEGGADGRSLQCPPHLGTSSRAWDDPAPHLI